MLTPVVGRRALLLGALGATVLSGCALEQPEPDPTPLPEPPSWPAGAPDDTEALQALLDAGGTVTLEERDYHVSARGEAGAALTMTVPGTILQLGAATRLLLAPNALDSYAIVHIVVEDCQVRGGTLVGDHGSHQADAGEWGHGILIEGQGHRATVEGVTATWCWGDGFYVRGQVAEASFIDCHASMNRRQGLSIVDVQSVTVRGGSYSYTGRFEGTSPSAGIDVEPGPGQAVHACDISGVLFEGSGGPGLVISGSGPVTATVSDCDSYRNVAGYRIAGASPQVTLTDCVARSNRDGFHVMTEKGSVTLVRCRTERNRNFGFHLPPNVEKVDLSHTERRNTGI